MNTDQFWQLIDATRGQPERGDMLTAALTTLPPDEIIRFQLLYDDVLQSANTVDLWGAAHQIMGGCSDDAFSDFREDLVELGREVFEAAVRNPDSLAGVFIPSIPYQPVQALHGAAGAAWMARTGQSENDFFDAVDAADDRADRGAGETGAWWNFSDPEEVRDRLPNLAVLYLKDEE
jgi:hypothetical protein